MNFLHTLLSVASGGLVGFTLGLVGGGGSILAVPLLVYVVGVQSPHVAIGTSAIAVAFSAAANLAGHARARTVKWSCALVFALSGIAGAAGGAQLGKMVDGGRLLMLFGALMVVVGLVMLKPRKSAGNPDVQLTRSSIPRLLPLLIGIGFLAGALSGFFGIGGGFLIVPGLMGATGMPLINAIGSSLVSITAFGLTTAAGELCLVRLGRLAPCRSLCRRRRTRRSARHNARQKFSRPQARALRYLFKLCHRGWALRHCKVDTGFLTPIPFGEAKLSEEYERCETRSVRRITSFGKAPNYFLAKCKPLPPTSGRVLAVADGEGRNSVWLAELGLDVHAIDFSPTAQDKARVLARERGVNVIFELADVHTSGIPGGRLRRGMRNLHAILNAVGEGVKVGRYAQSVEAGWPSYHPGLHPEAAHLRNRRPEAARPTLHKANAGKGIRRLPRYDFHRRRVGDARRHVA